VAKPPPVIVKSSCVFSSSVDSMLHTECKGS